MSASLASASPTAHLDGPEESVGYDLAGDGPLVVLAPGMGDPRTRVPVPRDSALGMRRTPGDE
jgi:hypothetical protein